MKQSAIEWLVNVVNSCIAPDYIPKEIIQQAKEMEKEQIIDFADKYGTYLIQGGTMSAGTYNETFKSE
jgi:hypothetical protein